MAPIEQITDSVGPNILIIEDAAQSQGAERGGSRSGAVGVAAATSFYPGKNLGAYGDAGAVTTRDEELAHRIRMLRNHGGTTKYEHELVGCNSRLDELQAVVLSTKLKVLDDWNAERRKAASRYAELLANVEEVEMPQTADRSVHVWHLYVVRVPRRDEILAALNSRGIAVGIHYPAPLHKLPAFADLDRGRGWYPNSELYAEEILSLPVYPGITAEQQWRVAEELQKALCG
jgi:dTDP-4-amino-4,6-dideoxygalactose transaminase